MTGLQPVGAIRDKVEAFEIFLKNPPRSWNVSETDGSIDGTYRRWPDRDPVITRSSGYKRIHGSPIDTYIHDNHITKDSKVFWLRVQDHVSKLHAAGYSP